MPRYAAIDIGSNSIRMMAAEVSHGETSILTQDRQVIRLGESVFRSGRISDEALTLMRSTLERMAASYKALEIIGVRAVATSAVRDAGNQEEFLQAAGSALGTNVEVISGPEEARLIHLGVEARWPRAKERTLIVDVGGGSAELIIAQNGQLLDSVSRPLGALRLNELFLKNDPPNPEELRRMDAYIEEKLAPFLKLHGAERFDRTIATSASAAAIVCAVNGIPRSRREEAERVRASAAQIRDLFQVLLSGNLESRRKITGIGPRRAEIVIPGTAVFLKVLESFNQKSFHYSSAGVRDGIIADLAARGVGRELAQLSREQRAVVEGMAKRYDVSLKHVRQVAFLAHRLFETLQPVHRLPPAAGKLLEAASILHDIGHFVSNTGHHKHSAYLVANSDMPGFTAKERLAIAALCRFHRKSMPQSRHLHFSMLDPESRRWITSLSVIIRLADSLDRSHTQRVRDVTSSLREGTLCLCVDADSDADLEIWSANGDVKIFNDVFSRPLEIQRIRSVRANAV